MDIWIIILVLLYFAGLDIFVIALLQPVRTIFYTSLLKRKEGKVLKVASNYENNLHFIVIARQIMLFFLPFFAALSIFGIDAAKSQLTSLFVLGLSINVFWVAQLSSLTKARLYIDFGVDQLNDLKSEIVLNSESEHIIYTRIYNLGFATLKNAVVLIYFGSVLDIVPFDDAKYNQLDFKKYFMVQKGNGGVAFMPTHDNYQNLPPQEWFLFPVIVKTPTIPANQEIEIQTYSENSWGLTRNFATLHIKQKPSHQQSS